MTKAEPAGTIAIAGASGFIGRHLSAALRARWRIVALSRRRRDAEEASAGFPVEWRACDLLRHDETMGALAGVDIAVYLVHTMLPRGRRAQGFFADHDLVAADNFARAAAANGVRHIVYLGGLVPDDDDALSDHLRSRVEVERALAGHGVPVTALRAGLVVGAGGSSFRIMHRLVARLPVMLTPSWTATPTHPIALADVVELIAWLVELEAPPVGAFDIGGPEVLTYRSMMALTAETLGLKRRILPVPVLTPRLSALWVRLITGAPPELVVPLVQSMVHPMVARDRDLQERAGIPGRTFAEAVTEAVRAEGADDVPSAPRSLRRAKPRRDIRAVHRVETAPGTPAAAVADAYLRWLPDGLLGFVAVDAEPTRLTLRFRGIPVPLLILDRRPQHDTETRAFLEVVGGLLAGPEPGGDLEFRRVPDYRGVERIVLAIVEGFVPRLPWAIYRWSQAPAHQWVMRAFDRALRAGRAVPSGQAQSAVGEARLRAAT